MSVKDNCTSAYDSLSATIASGASLSGTINVGGLRLFAITMPSAWTAAGVSFQVSSDEGATWANLYDASGNELVSTADAGRCIALDPVPFSFAQYLRLRSGTASAPVAQSSDRVLQLEPRAI